MPEGEGCVRVCPIAASLIVLGFGGFLDPPATLPFSFPPLLSPVSQPKGPIPAAKPISHQPTALNGPNPVVSELWAGDPAQAWRRPRSGGLQP